MSDQHPALSSQYAILVLRLGIGAVILWFGLNEILHPEAWLSYIPEWSTSFGLTPESILFLNGVFEVILGVFLILGIFARVAAVLLFVHIILIIADIGLTSIGMRDVGIASALLALTLHERDEFSLR